MIELKNVCKRFDSTIVLDHVDLCIDQGKITTIIGKSGTGKTVILKHLIGLIEPDSGQILFDGQDLLRLRRKSRNTIKNKFGFMFQNVALFDAMTTYENVALPLREKTKLSEKQIQQKVMSRLEQLEVENIANKYPAEISGGMKKRVGLARVLVTEPEIILFDEPTTGLDPIRKNAVHSMISQMQKRLGFTAIIVSHEIPDIFYLSHKIAMLDHGKILFYGTPDMIQHCKIPIVQAFIKGVENIKDELTGLNTKSVLFEQFEELSHTNQPNTLVTFKIDQLDQINEQLGYSVGQTLFQRFSILMRSLVTPEATISKYHNNTILMLLPNTSLQQSQQIITTIQTTLRLNAPLPKSNYPPITYSISTNSVEITPDLWVLEEAAAKTEQSQQTIATFTTG